MRTFKVTFCGEATIELNNQVIDVVDDDWRACLYPLDTPEDIARHIAYNLIFRHARLSGLDGWADQPDTNAVLIDIGEVKMEAQEEETVSEPIRP